MPRQKTLRVAGFILPTPLLETESSARNPCPKRRVEVPGSLRQDASDPASEVFRIDRLDHPAGDSLTSLGVEFARMPARENQDRQKAVRGEFTHRGHEGQAVEVGHLQVGQEEVARQLAQHAQGRLAVGNRNHLEVQIAELFRDPAPDRGAVVSVNDGLVHRVGFVFAAFVGAGLPREGPIPTPEPPRQPLTKRASFMDLNGLTGSDTAWSV